MPPQDLFREDYRLGRGARFLWLAGIAFCVVVASCITYDTVTHGADKAILIVPRATLVLLPLLGYLATSAHTVRVTSGGVEVVWGHIGRPRWRIAAEAIEWYRVAERVGGLSLSLKGPMYKGVRPLSLTPAELAGGVEIKRRASRRLYLLSTNSPQQLAAAIEAATGLSPGSRAAYSEQEGDTPDTAVVIEVADEFAGVHAEYEWLEQHLGPRDVAWEFQSQALFEHDGRPMDCLTVRLRDGTVREFYFDISAFFGEM